MAAAVAPNEALAVETGVDVGGVVPPEIIAKAKLSEERDLQMGIRGAFTKYRKATAWSLILSCALVMDGFFVNVSLIDVIFAYAVSWGLFTVKRSSRIVSARSWPQTRPRPSPASDTPGLVAHVPQLNGNPVCQTRGPSEGSLDWPSAPGRRTSSARERS